MKLYESLIHIGETNMHALAWFVCNFFPLYFLAVRYVQYMDAVTSCLGSIVDGITSM
jgi:hypothetical protein